MGAREGIFYDWLPPYEGGRGKNIDHISFFTKRDRDANGDGYRLTFFLQKGGKKVL